MFVGPIRRRWTARRHPTGREQRAAGRRWSSAAALLAVGSLGLLVSGCGGDGGSTPEKDEEVFLQPATEPGPDPYTATTARALAAPVPEPVVPAAIGSEKPTRGQTLRVLSGATPGLYGGTEAVGSCDVQQQITLLRADGKKARAFADGADVAQRDVPRFLRDLTPVVLRADTRVTSRGFRDGKTTAARQTVLQAGTAVLVDRRGAPRVRCASGTPLAPPVAVKGGVIQKGTPWHGYRLDRVVVVKPTTQDLDSLVIVDVSQDTWIDRRTGTDGEDDRRPDVVPPVAPDDIYAYPSEPNPEPQAEESDPGGALVPPAPDATGAETEDALGHPVDPLDPFDAPDSVGSGSSTDALDPFDLDLIDSAIDGLDIPSDQGVLFQGPGRGGPGGSTGADGVVAA
ncbi:DUF6777 domain-containing protein [Streptomyces sp. NPDC020412]|uniref:DUF6777 domain-containing protein n=1 Tax=Streptomyces sp. NPDC020412 TaxID=3365073 RepID=UPI0037BA8342